MQTATLPLNSSIVEKTRELCGSLLELPEYKDNMAHIEAFLADDSAKAQYGAFAQLGDQLHEKQQAGTITDTDIEGFDTMKAELNDNPKIDKFLGAQDSLNGIAQMVSKHVAKTLELGRVPTPEEMEDSGCCSSGGCGC